ncbi:MAG: porin [Pseudomonadales bacterium]|nr:porin [Pseudomonadales bacterium]
MNLIRTIATASLCTFSLSCLAEPELRTNAFITAGLSYVDSEIPYAGTDDNLSANDVSKLGVQFTFDPDIEIPVTFTMQLLTKGRNNWDVEAEWAYLSYQASDNLTLKVGKVLAPYFMISQSINVGITYPWSIPPEEIYGPANIPFTSIAGFDLTYSGYVGDYGYAVTFYNGENGFTVPASGLTVDVDMDRSTGFVLEVTNDYGMLRYSIHDITFTDNLATAAAPLPVPDTTDGEVLFTTFGAKFEWNNILVMSEYAKRALSNSIFPTTKSWYVTTGYRIGKYLPTITYSEIETSNSDLNQSQNTIMASLEITTSASTRLNFDLSRISPDNGSTGLFDTLPESFGGDPVKDTTKFTTSFSMVY